MLSAMRTGASLLADTMSPPHAIGASCRLKPVKNKLRASSAVIPARWYSAGLRRFVEQQAAFAADAADQGAADQAQQPRQVDFDADMVVLDVDAAGDRLAHRGD